MTKLQVVKHYKTLLQCDRFLLTGSEALAHYGLIPFEKVHDLDLVLINPTDETLNLLRRLQKDKPASTSPSTAAVQFIFMHDGLKIDVFIESNNEIGSTMSVEDVELNPIRRIVAKKKAANRSKDWQQLNYIARQFVTHEEVSKFLNSY